MRRLYGLIVLIGVLLVVLGVTVPTTSHVSTASSSTSTTLAPVHNVMVPVPVRNCPARSQGPQLPPAAPVGTTETLSLASNVVGKVALYQGGGVRLVAPMGWLCQTSVYFDGNVIMSIAPDPTDAVGFFPEPSNNQSNSARVQFNGIPTCSQCSLAQVCPFFPSAVALLHHARSSTKDCRLSPGEVVTARSLRVVGVIDPPGVVGHGTPSGGPYFAVTRVFFSRHGANATGSYIVTCTLPTNLATLCSSSLSNFVAAYPHYGV